MTTTNVHPFTPQPGSAICVCGLPKRAEVHDVDRYDSTAELGDAWIEQHPTAGMGTVPTEADGLPAATPSGVAGPLPVAGAPGNSAPGAAGLTKTESTSSDPHVGTEGESGFLPRPPVARSDAAVGAASPGPIFVGSCPHMTAERCQVCLDLDEAVGLLADHPPLFGAHHLKDLKEPWCRRRDALLRRVGSRG